MRYLVATARPVAEDLTGTLTFYLLYALTGSILLSFTMGLLLGAAQLVRHLMRRERVPALLVTGLALTMLLGGLGLVSHDPRFVMLKPTIFYGFLAATMLPRGWIARYLPEVARDLLPSRTLDRLGWGWATLMAATAMLNLILLFALPAPRAAALFVAWLIGSKLALFAAQYALMRPIAGRAHRARREALERAEPLP